MITLKVNCGCGFNSKDLEEGQKHANTTGHILHVQGEIKKGESNETNTD